MLCALGKNPHTHGSWQQDLIECCFQSEIDNQSSTNKTLCCSISKHVHICCSDSPSKVSHLSAINEALQGKIRLLENRIARLQDDVETNNLVNSGNNGMTAIMMSKPKKSRDHSKPVIFNSFICFSNTLGQSTIFFIYSLVSLFAFLAQCQLFIYFWGKIYYLNCNSS